MSDDLKDKWSSLESVIDNYRALVIVFVFLLALNLWVFAEANTLAFSQEMQPYDFYTFLRASSEIWTNPEKVYVPWTTAQLSPYWQRWCWYGSVYAYPPMFAAFLSPLSALFPPTAKLIWETISLLAVVFSGYICLRMFKSYKTKLFFLLMVFIMPFNIYTEQILPQYWLPQKVTMWISPVNFTNYYWGATCSVNLFFGLLAIWFSTLDSVNIPFLSRFQGFHHIPGYVLSSMFLALGSFKITVLPFFLPFWLLLNRKNWAKSIIYFIFFVVAFNFSIFIHPSLLSDYIGSILNRNGSTSYVFTQVITQIYNYIWIYTLPLASIFILLKK